MFYRKTQKIKIVNGTEFLYCCIPLLLRTSSYDCISLVRTRRDIQESGIRFWVQCLLYKSFSMVDLSWL